MLSYLRGRFTILSPDLFLEKLLASSLASDDIVISFDDSLLSQFEVALPVLDSYGIRAVFNVYSSVFTGAPDPLEIYAMYRATEFDLFDDYWATFQTTVESLKPGICGLLEQTFPDNWLIEFPFYSENERKFRFMRDKLLAKTDYAAAMTLLISDARKFNLDDAVEQAWMRPKHLGLLVAGGHSIGLHSHTHPTQMADLSESDQLNEYLTNKDWIEGHLGVTPEWVAHPCGSYSAATLEILTRLGIRGGFRSSLTPGRYASPLEVPREDHANLIRHFDKAEK
jgi:peptidoglycan/xylan/chitin deacetylase (PgdA/CDA1 family)